MGNEKRRSISTSVQKQNGTLSPKEPIDYPKQLRSGNWPIALLPGLSDSDQVRLQGCGIQTTWQLLQQTRTPAQKQALVSRLQIHSQHVNKWVALADLAQIPAVGCQHCGLLLHVGIASPAQLAQTSLPRLHHQIIKLQVAMMQRQDLCPSLDEVARWIEQARQFCGRQRTASRK